MKVIFETQGNRPNRGKATTFVLNFDNIDGAGVYGDTMRVYGSGKTLYIEFADIYEAGAAMGEMIRAMREDKSIVVVSVKPLNIVDE